MKYDEKQNKKKSTTKSNKNVSRFILNTTQKPNTIKSVHFTSLKQGPMGDAVIEGYINNNKEDEFVAFASSEDNFQFQGDMIESKKYQI